MKQVLQYFHALSLHNDKAWFDAHKAEYERAKRTITDLAIDLIGGIRAFDDSIGPLSVTDSYPLSEMRIRFLPGISIIC